VIRRATARRDSSSDPLNRGDDGGRPADGGMSLVEIVVGMALGGVLLAVVGSIFLTSINAMGDQQARTALSGESRVVMESVARRARVAIRPAGEAAAIVTATSTQLTLYSSVMDPGAATEPAPVKAEYYVDRGCLMEARTPGRKRTAPGPAGQVYLWDTGRTVTCLAHVQGAPAFTYYDTAALAQPDGTPVAPMTVPAAGLTATARDQVRSVGLRLSVADAARAKAGRVEVSTRVTLTNLATDAIGG
jgi:type II secretory pathway pseudopilin PulG